jgi:hypothetical protein
VRREDPCGFSTLVEEGDAMYATVRRYDGIDTTRSEEIVRKVDETLIPRLSELEGFQGYYLIDAGGGALTSIGLFERSAQGEESTRLVAEWVRDEQLESAIPNPPTLTTGTVVAHKNAAQHALAAAV